MQEAPPRTDEDVAAPAGRPRSAQVLRWIGWTLIVAGVIVALYIVHALYFTDLATDRDQGALIEEWESQIGDLDADEHLALQPEPGAESGDPDGSDEAESGGQDGSDASAGADGNGGNGEPPVDVGDAVAVMAFSRPGEDERPVNSDPLAILGDVTVPDLQRGPGHYPSTAMPGEDGNFAVAGHRVTYGRPFYHLDEIRPGDEVHVWDRDGAKHVYEVTGTEIVSPHDGWVLGADPQGTGNPTLTLTTCHPRFSQRERLIMFAELVE